ncbi:hypothetical protein [Moorena sp. SIO1F2]|uniref:hypothetical protein n=1 Tax=Moorena sp. SIO1F2 TaxID=2607819 RepID=UPI0025CE58F8|nr:hypothetical protein [Moorena sp. SIO1F2]
MRYGAPDVNSKLLLVDYAAPNAPYWRGTEILDKTEGRRPRHRHPSADCLP